MWPPVAGAAGRGEGGVCREGWRSAGDAAWGAVAQGSSTEHSAPDVAVHVYELAASECVGGYVDAVGAVAGGAVQASVCAVRADGAPLVLQVGVCSGSGAVSAASVSAEVQRVLAVSAGVSAGAARLLQTCSETGLCNCVDQPNGGITCDMKASSLDKHNEHRAGVSPTASNMLRLTWDPMLEEVAQAYAEQCIWGHNSARTSDYAAEGGSGYVGENLAVGTSGYYTVVRVRARRDDAFACALRASGAAVHVCTFCLYRPILCSCGTTRWRTTPSRATRAPVAPCVATTHRRCGRTPLVWAVARRCVTAWWGCPFQVACFWCATTRLVATTTGNLRTSAARRAVRVPVVHRATAAARCVRPL